MHDSDTQAIMKPVANVLRHTTRHWVGNGFPVRTLFSYEGQGQDFSPFLLFDYAGPHEFPPTDSRLGVGPHPHRGFETVTIVYAGEVEHRDSSGSGGRIGPGDVQWMTAASGLIHEEFHGQEYARRGGLFEMVQLWVNLPAKDKTALPRYQHIPSAEIPTVALPGASGSVRVIAGEYAGKKGPANTFSPVHVWDLRVSSNEPVTIAVEDGYTTVLAVLKGTLTIPDSEPVSEAEVVTYARHGTLLRLDAAHDVSALLLCGQPLEEPIVGYGPFVMNTTQEIDNAMDDYTHGRMGTLS